MEQTPESGTFLENLGHTVVYFLEDPGAISRTQMVQERSFSTLLCAGQPRVPLLLWAKVQLMMGWLQRQNNCSLPATRNGNLSYYVIYHF